MKEYDVRTVNWDKLKRTVNEWSRDGWETVCVWPVMSFGQPPWITGYEVLVCREKSE